MRFHDKILGWYDNHHRILPWRAMAGQTPEPYRVWLSEIMLQQTTVATVKSYFVKFLDLWPDVRALADAELDDVLAAWAGLGYYARARNLRACAKIVCKQYDGVFPQNTKELEKLPGIGAYTSGAIAAIAFDQPVAAVDGNVERVLSRYYAITTPLPASKPLIREKAIKLVPSKRAGDFAQSLMDLGATICTPAKPRCSLCPLAGGCAGLKKDIALNLPAKLAKKPRPTRYGTAFVVQRADGTVLLRKRPAKGLLGGMLEVPSSPWLQRVEPISGTLKSEELKPDRLNVIEHTFTHFHLVLEVTSSDTILKAEKRDEQSHQWVAIDQLSNKALPTVMKKVLSKALGPDILKA